LTKGAFTEKILAKRNDMSEIIEWDLDCELTDKIINWVYYYKIYLKIDQKLFKTQ